MLPSPAPTPLPPPESILFGSLEEGLDSASNPMGTASIPRRASSACCEIVQCAAPGDGIATRLSRGRVRNGGALQDFRTDRCFHIRTRHFERTHSLKTLYFIQEIDAGPWHCLRRGWKSGKCLDGGGGGGGIGWSVVVRLRFAFTVSHSAFRLSLSPSVSSSSRTASAASSGGGSSTRRTTATARASGFRNSCGDLGREV